MGKGDASDAVGRERGAAAAAPPAVRVLDGALGWDGREVQPSSNHVNPPGAREGNSICRSSDFISDCREKWY